MLFSCPFIVASESVKAGYDSLPAKRAQIDADVDTTVPPGGPSQITSRPDPTGILGPVILRHLLPAAILSDGEGSNSG